MNYFKSYKRKKKIPIFSKILVCAIIFYIVYEIIDISNNKLKGENLEKSMSIENIIEQESKIIVGISKEYQNFDGSSKIWGSGIIVSKYGYILTNEHISGAMGNFCDIIVDYNKKYKANVVWSNSELDLAILKVECNFEQCAVFGDSAQLMIGQNVYTIGNPINMSFQKSVGSGIVSGLNRNLEFEESGKKFYLNNLIQTDAMINPGNSGGALINEKGEVIGITTIKISSADFMGFAVPINIVKPVIEKIEKEGSFKEATLKIWCYDKYSINEIEKTVDIKEGILVAQIEANSNAEKSGLKVGDIIISIDAKTINSIEELKSYIYERYPNDNIILKIKRNNNIFLVNIKLEEK